LSGRLAACGSAKARFLDDKGKPIAKYHPVLWMLLPSGPYPDVANRVFTNMAFSPNGNLLLAQYQYRTAVMLHNSAKRNWNWVWNQAKGPAIDRVWWGQADPAHFAKGPLTDPQGAVTFPNLIAGATYRFFHLDGKVKDFKVEAGKTLDLSDITITPPPKPPFVLDRPLNHKRRVKVIKPPRLFPPGEKKTVKKPVSKPKE
jgi:hypothetical protein